MSKKNSVVRQTPVKHCILCGVAGPTSEEHIVPAWIFRAFDKAGIPYTRFSDITHVLPDGNVNAYTSVTSDDATSPILCTPCNGEFSKKIQTRASEVLTDFLLVDGKN